MILKIKIETLLLAMLLIGMVWIPAASAQEEKDYSVTAEKAFEHANAHMIHFIANNAPDFENWTEASIDHKPMELYDINGQKLFYQYSVYKNNNLIGRIDVFANKTLGASVNDIEFDPKPFKASEAMKKSIEIAKSKYPAGEIKSTQMVVYNYPNIGAMTVVKDKTTGDKYRIFVDAYTLDVVPDKPATLTESGVWSMYEHSSKNGIDKNLEEWQKSDQLTKFVGQEAVNMGINTSAPITEENMNKLSGDAGILLGSSKTLTGVPKYGQQNSVYCGPASCQMIGKYICNIYRTQDYIYDFQGWHDHNNLNGGISDSDARDYCYYTQQQGGLGQRGTIKDYSLRHADAISEINNNRPFFSMITGHFRVCRGYSDTGLGLVYIYLIDPLPVGQGSYRTETNGAQEIERIYVRP